MRALAATLYAVSGRPECVLTSCAIEALCCGWLISERGDSLITCVPLTWCSTVALVRSPPRRMTPFYRVQECPASHTRPFRREPSRLFSARHPFPSLSCYRRNLPTLGRILRNTNGLGIRGHALSQQGVYARSMRVGGSLPVFHVGVHAGGRNLVTRDTYRKYLSCHEPS